jgi:hypothetical protein
VSLAKVYDSSKIIDVAESPAIDERISSHWNVCRVFGKNIA